MDIHVKGSWNMLSKHRECFKGFKSFFKSPTITTVTETIAQALFDLTAFAHNAFVPRTIVLCISTQY